MSSINLNDLTPAEFRQLVKNGQYDKPTSGLCLGHKQANVIVLEKKLASIFEKISECNW